MSASALMREALRQCVECQTDRGALEDTERLEREALVDLFERTPFEMGRKPTREEMQS